MKIGWSEHSLQSEWVLLQIEVRYPGLAAKPGNEQVRRMSNTIHTCACREPLFVEDTYFFYIQELSLLKT